MKARLRQQLRCFKGQIERRLARENERSDHDGYPVLRGTGASYEIASRVRAVAAGGIGLMHQMAKAIGLDREIDDRVRLLRFHAPYEESDHVLNITFNSLAGGECLDHLEFRPPDIGSPRNDRLRSPINVQFLDSHGPARPNRVRRAPKPVTFHDALNLRRPASYRGMSGALELLRNDVNYMDMLGARRIPDPTTAGDFCRRFKSSGDVDDLQDAINETQLRVWSSQPSEFFEHALIDADGSFVETTGDCKEGADFSYKKGFGYHPLIVSLANTQEVLSIENRPGNRPSPMALSRIAPPVLS